MYLFMAHWLLWRNYLVACECKSVPPRSRADCSSKSVGESCTCTLYFILQVWSKRTANVHTNKTEHVDMTEEEDLDEPWYKRLNQRMNGRSYGDRKIERQTENKSLLLVCALRSFILVDTWIVNCHHVPGLACNTLHFTSLYRVWHWPWPIFVAK